MSHLKFFTLLCFVIIKCNTIYGQSCEKICYGEKSIFEYKSISLNDTTYFTLLDNEIKFDIVIVRGIRIIHEIKDYSKSRHDELIDVAFDNDWLRIQYYKESKPYYHYIIIKNPYNNDEVELPSDSTEH
jgi:hypothetical protein